MQAFIDSWALNDWRLWLLLGLASLVLYLARPHAHRLIRALCGLFAGLFLVGGHAIGRWGRRIDDGYRRQLVEIRAEEIEQVLLREQKQLTARLGAELSGYPELHRRLVDDLFALEQDYRASTLALPGEGFATTSGDHRHGMLELPLSATASLAGPADEESVAIVPQQPGRLATEWRARRSNRERMSAMARIVRRLGPIQQLLEKLQDVDLRAQGASRRIETALDEYRALLLGAERREITLGVSSLQRFLVGILFGAVAIGGAALNFFLIERPMAEMVGEAYEIAGMSLPRAAALVMIMLEATAGIALMEFWGVTRLVSFIDRIEPWKRRVLTVVSLLLLVALASIEAGLALVREDIIRASEATLQQLSGTTPVAASPSVLPMVVQATLGFIIPFLLALIAIPLELLLTYGPALLSWLAGAVLTLVSLALRLVHRVLRGLSALLIALYDVLIFLPLGVERLVLAVLALRRPPSAGAAG